MAKWLAAPVSAVKSHNEYAGAHGGLELIAQNAGQQEQHHHAAARAHEAADKADDHAAGHRLEKTASGD